MIPENSDYLKRISYNCKKEPVAFGFIGGSTADLTKELRQLRQSGHSATIRRIIVDDCSISMEAIDSLVGMPFPKLKSLNLRNKKNI